MLPLEVELRDPPTVPVYQKIAAQAAEMWAQGVPFRTIAEHFGVDHHTAAKAVWWFQQPVSACAVARFGARTSVNLVEVRELVRAGKPAS